ncbi:MAG TPA: dephospho-CoA kinase [Candidatus Limnocylindrales bacterium]|nr:dephospho-CoA kinase [Candidatus Limnocylindrales bacterium]
MLKIGLTGGIATGKTTVAAMLRDRDCMVLEMDPIGHELLEPEQEAYDEVVGEFGLGVLGEGAVIDRAKLGAIVFADPVRRERLNAILHPRILDVVGKWFAALARPGGPEFAFVEAALIFESGYDKELNRVVVCWCRPEQQLERLKERELTPEQARARIAAQMPIDEKRRRANDVIDCSKSVEDSERQVEALVQKLKQLAKAGGNIR